MVTAADVLAISLYVTDAGGLYPTAPLPTEAAEAIADECSAHPFNRYPWVPGDLACAALYTFHSFREGNWNLLAVGDFQDALGKSCKRGEPGCKPRAFGPFQVWRRPPTTWAEACTVFTQLLHTASVCDEPLEMLAAGKCGTVKGAWISRARTSGSLGVLFAWWMKR